MSKNVEDHKEMISQTKLMYYAHQIIFEDSTECLHNHDQNDFYKFLEQDDRKAILDGEMIKFIDEKVLRKKQNYLSSIRSNL